MSNRDIDKQPLLDDLEGVAARVRKTGGSLPFITEIPVENIDILRWLAAAGKTPSYYWRSRDGRLELGGFGNGFTAKRHGPTSPIRTILDLTASTPECQPVCFYGRSFSDTAPADEVWTGFPREICTIPEIMIIRRGDRFAMHRCFEITGDTDVENIARRMDVAAFRNFRKMSRSLHDPLPAHATCTHYPDYESWRRNIESILAAVSSGLIEKAVLARRTDYDFKTEIDPFSLLIRLMRQNRNGYAILYSPEPGSAFVSVTPERLFRRGGDRIEIDAVSSTVPRGTDDAEDRRLADALLRNDKFRREHWLVIDGVCEAIEPLCRDFPTVGDTAVLRLERIQHLATCIEGRLDSDVDDHRIIEALHPTPAVGGVARVAALRLLSSLEPFSRGWYASPAGIITAGDSEYAVAIRSAVVRGRRVSVFTGAGIVAGSDPEAEWNEINGKDILRPLLPGRGIA